MTVKPLKNFFQSLLIFCCNIGDALPVGELQQPLQQHEHGVGRLEMCSGVGPQEERLRRPQVSLVEGERPPGEPLTPGTVTGRRAGPRVSGQCRWAPQGWTWLGGAGSHSGAVGVGPQGLGPTYWVGPQGKGRCTCWWPTPKRLERCWLPHWQGQPPRVCTTLVWWCPLPQQPQTLTLQGH